jgi:hypothetical protein
MNLGEAQIAQKGRLRLTGEKQLRSVGMLKDKQSIAIQRGLKFGSVEYQKGIELLIAERSRGGGWLIPRSQAVSAHGAQKR